MQLRTQVDSTPRRYRRMEWSMQSQPHIGRTSCTVRCGAHLGMHHHHRTIIIVCYYRRERYAAPPPHSFLPFPLSVLFHSQSVLYPCITPYNARCQARRRSERKGGREKVETKGFAPLGESSTCSIGALVHSARPTVSTCRHQ